MGKRVISAATPHHAQAQVPGRRPNVDEAKHMEKVDWSSEVERAGWRDGIINIAQQGFFHFFFWGGVDST
jgi:hypothetical protein